MSAWGFLSPESVLFSCSILKDLSVQLFNLLRGRLKDNIKDHGIQLPKERGFADHLALRI